MRQVRNVPQPTGPQGVLHGTELLQQRAVKLGVEAYGLPISATAVSAEILADRGNTSSPSVLFVLDRLQQTSAPRPSVMLAFGPGLLAEAALLT